MGRHGVSIVEGIQPIGHSDMLFVDRIPADADLLDDDGNPIGVRKAMPVGNVLM